MKKQAFFLFLAIYLSINASAELDCRIFDIFTSSCDDQFPNSLLVLRMHDASNTHAQLPDYSGNDPKYDIGVCCRATKATLIEDTDNLGVLDYACSGQPESTYTALSDESNAHAEFPIDPIDNTFKWGEPGENYDNTMCMNATSEIRCEAQAAEINEPPPGFNSMSECVFGLSSETNAHVYECRQTPQDQGFLKVYCTDEYSTKGDILGLKIQPLDAEGNENKEFYTGGNIYLKFNINNFTNSPVTGVQVDYYVKGLESTIKNSIVRDLNPGLNIIESNEIPPLLIPVDTPRNSYLLEAKAIYPDDPVQGNNLDNEYITIILGTKEITIPETSPLLAVLIAFGVLFIIGGMPRKSLN
ncbi:MAG: hypothetical protein Q7K34_02890 [archaeon]|nr:hypothetical protein [archaeon]